MRKKRGARGIERGRRNCRGRALLVLVGQGPAKGGVAEWRLIAVHETWGMGCGVGWRGKRAGVGAWAGRRDADGGKRGDGTPNYGSGTLAPVSVPAPAPLLHHIAQAIRGPDARATLTQRTPALQTLSRPNNPQASRAACRPSTSPSGRRCRRRPPRAPPPGRGPPPATRPCSAWACWRWRWARCGGPTRRRWWRPWCSQA